MKKLLLTSATLALLIVNTACEKESTAPNKASESLKNVPARFAEQTSRFAFDFWKKLDAAEPKGKNYFVSPLSLNIALGMLLNGADGSTKTEIENVLNLGNNQQANNEIYQNLIENLPNADAKVSNKIANSVWYRNDFSVEKPFLTDLQKYFYATVMAEDFANPNTVKKINQWASDNTNAKITKVLEEITDGQVMFLMNALYFKGDWTKPFDTKSTQDATFTNLNGSNKVVKMMYMTDKLRYTKRANYQAVELPYGNGNYNMTILLPSHDSNVNELITKLNASEWSSMAADLKEQKIMLSLPKFTLEYEIKLNNILSAMGMPTAFSDAANLSKISPPAGKLNVGFVKQNTYVGVDEKGTEAAAVTTIGVELTSLPNYPEFFVNRPFIFVIHEKSSNTILFTGKMVNM